MTSVDSQKLHKSQTPFLALLREKTTDKEKEEKRTLLETLSCRRKKTESGFYYKKKRTFLGTWSLRKKEKIHL